MEQLTNLLAQLAEKLGTTVEHLYQVMMAQTAIEAQLCNLWMGIWLWGGVIVLVGSIVLMVLMVSFDGEEAVGFPAFTFITTLIIAPIGYYTMYSELLTLTQNPEFWVIQEILNKL